MGESQGKKLLKDLETRWISMLKPTYRVFNEYQSLVGFMYRNHRE